MTTKFIEVNKRNDNIFMFIFYQVFVVVCTVDKMKIRKENMIENQSYVKNHTKTSLGI